MDEKPKERQKAKLLYLARMFFQETDENHGLTMPQIVEYLEERGVPAERKALYRDIDALRSFGLDIAAKPTRPVEYALVKRTFSKTELALLVDAVQSSRFLTENQAGKLVRSIKTLASRHGAKALSKQIHVEGRIKMQNDSVFRNVDVIREALRQRRKVAFHYFKYDVNLREQTQRDGKRYCETPLALIYSDGCYYLVAYNDKYASLVHYRVDRMRSLLCTEERATSNDVTRNFDAAAYQESLFGMFGGTRHAATLLVHESVMGGVVDRFGKDVVSTPAPEAGRTKDVDAPAGKWARVSVTVTESPAFFAWLVRFGTKMRIEKPNELAQAYRTYLESIVLSYR